MHSHVFRHGRLPLQPRAAQLALEPALGLVHGHVLLQLRADAKVLSADLALVLVGEVDRVLVPEINMLLDYLTYQIFHLVFYFY